MLTNVYIFTVIYRKFQNFTYAIRLLRINLITGNVFNLFN